VPCAHSVAGTDSRRHLKICGSHVRTNEEALHDPAGKWEQRDCQAESGALQFAGVDVNLESIADDQKVDVPTAHWELVRSGLGPQNICVRELHDSAVEVVLTNEGQLAFRFGNFEEADEEIFGDYPALVTALDEIARQEDRRITTEFATERLAEAVAWNARACS